ncbi:MAG: DALR anticodon-binding domain-containing protein [Synechococcales bacterium]|nr:DALR anticodon-binding domain-containing protein [Synechococcales bacterium]
MIVPAWRSLLAYLLYEAVHEWQQAVGMADSAVHTSVFGGSSPATISLKKVKNIRWIRYASAIALRLAKMSDLCPIKIAKNITELLNDVSKFIEGSTRVLPDLPYRSSPITLINLLRPDITIEVLGQGYLQFTITDAGMARWLQWFIDWPMALPTNPVPDGGEWLPQTQAAAGVFSSTLKPPFTGFYAYARCCSLLRLAHSEGILKPGVPDEACLTRLGERSEGGSPGRWPAPWGIQQPHPLPWLTTNAALQFQNIADQALLHQLVEAVDAIASLAPFYPPAQTVKPMQALSNAFAIFYAAYPIGGGGHQPQALEQTQARLGLVSITAQVLQIMFERGWGVLPPGEL